MPIGAMGIPKKKLCNTTDQKKNYAVTTMDEIGISLKLEGLKFH